MDINFLAIAIAVVLQFILGAVWYSPLMFGKIWMKIHDCDKLSKDELQKMQKEMGPFYGLQLIVTSVTTVILAVFINALPQFSPFIIAFWFWLGFVVPTQVSAIIFGGDEKKWFLKKIVIIAGSALACLTVAAAVLTILK